MAKNSYNSPTLFIVTMPQNEILQAGKVQEPPKNDNIRKWSTNNFDAAKEFTGIKMAMQKFKWSRLNEEVMGRSSIWKRSDL